MSHGRIAERVAAMPRCTAMSKQTRRRCQRPASPGYPVCYWHAAHRNGGPIDNLNPLKSGTWMREQQAALKAGVALGRAVRAVGRNALAQLNGEISAEEGNAQREKLWHDIANAQVTQVEARKEKARRLRAKRRKSGAPPV